MQFTKSGFPLSGSWVLTVPPPDRAWIMFNTFVEKNRHFRAKNVKRRYLLSSGVYTVIITVF